jgi:hypothetical protein
MANPAGSRPPILSPSARAPEQTSAMSARYVPGRVEPEAARGTVRDALLRAARTMLAAADPAAAVLEDQAVALIDALLVSST